MPTSNSPPFLKKSFGALVKLLLSSSHGHSTSANNSNLHVECTSIPTRIVNQIKNEHYNGVDDSMFFGWILGKGKVYKFFSMRFDFLRFFGNTFDDFYSSRSTVE